MALPYKEEKLGNTNNVSELIDFKIVKFASQSLLGIGKADVLLLYKKKPGETDKEQKRLLIFGPEDAVYQRALNKIAEKKNPQKAKELENKFRDEWKTTDHSPLSHQKILPSTFLKHKFFDLGLNTKEFSKISGVAAPSLYHHVSGSRDVDRDTAIEYAKKLGCDPVDLMFDKKVVPIWSKVNLLKPEELDEYYAPGRLFSYTIAKEDDVVDYAYDKTIKPLEKVVVPRDIYREDIKAIKIEARGSMYHDKVAFYYRASDKTGDYLNQLCVVGIDVEVMPDVNETQYFFGLYEEMRGKSNLINPDPFISNMEHKYILQDFNPKFIAPIIAVVNPAAVVDQTKLKKAIPQAALVNKEEELKTQIEYLRNRANYHKEEAEKAKIKSFQSAKERERITKELVDRQQKAQKEVDILLSKVEEITDRINAEMSEKQNRRMFPSLFKKEQEVLDRFNRDLRIVTGGKK